ncbi:MAG: NADH-quinone oxidoreductase subunit NuoK [Armatimonadetes bacterium]|nr:NADH-quinone oxidoreductase subunit NuoK [Armatimonadota bacterium]MBS1710983.1 NADH-quinone oxidoreductase subunit NuoK [Armatimonadota bacterium]MBX3108655.1 NADH-quinone oxidoreductase subunit NuoK [Fimbriimonadaceae bacterium]
MVNYLPLADVHSEIPLGAFLGLSLAMFALGALGVLIRKNPVVVFMCIELMLNAVNLSFLAFAAYPNPAIAGLDPAKSAMSGQAMVMIVMAIAAAEVAVGLGIIMAIFRYRNQVDVDEMNSMRG